MISLALILASQAASVCGYVSAYKGLVQLKRPQGAKILVVAGDEKVCYGDSVKVNKGGILIISLGKRAPRIFTPSDKWQVVKSGPSAIKSSTEKAMQDIVATIASKGGADAVICPTAYEFTVQLPAGRRSIDAKIERNKTVIWAGTLQGDEYGFYRNPSIGPALASMQRDSGLTLKVSNTEIQFQLRDKGVEAKLLDALTRASLLSTPEERAWGRYDAYLTSGFMEMAVREAMRLTGL